VQAASVNPIDVKRAAGYGRRLLALKGAGRFPLVLGNDCAGVVRAVASKAGPWRAGQRVYGLVPTGQGGAHCTELLADERWLRPAPDHCSAEQLAAMPYCFTTMFLAVRAAGLEPSNANGRRVLVNGASGGLGRLALQVLVPWGAKVTAVCSTPDVQACLDLGAEEVLDRRVRPLTSLTSRFDATLNFGAWSDDPSMLERLKPDALGHATAVHPLLENFDRLGWIGGLRATLRDLSRQRRALKQRSPQARYQWVTFKPDRAALDTLQSMLAADAVSLPIGLAVPLEQAAAAFAHVHERRPGRALLLPRNP
jgi:NADPH:quinone reductase-like Zn-dependent oxidoreductase